MNTKKHKNQHYVPRFYLKQWCDPNVPHGQEPYVWVFSKEGGEGKSRSPQNIFCKNDLYTRLLPDGKRDLTLENYLSRIEGKFKEIIEKICNKIILSGSDIFYLYWFVAFQLFRTPSFGDCQQAMEEMLVEMDQNGDKIPLSDNFFRRMRVEENFKKKNTLPFLGKMLPGIPVMTEYFIQEMRAELLCSVEPVNFITSDNPVSLFYPEEQTKNIDPHRFNLFSQKVEIIFPMAPNRLLIMNHKKPTEEVSAPGYIDICDNIIRWYNVIILNNSDKKIINNKNSYFA